MIRTGNFSGKAPYSARASRQQQVRTSVRLSQPLARRSVSPPPLKAATTPNGRGRGLGRGRGAGRGRGPTVIPTVSPPLSRVWETPTTDAPDSDGPNTVSPRRSLWKTPTSPALGSPVENDPHSWSRSTVDTMGSLGGAALPAMVSVSSSISPGGGRAATSEPPPFRSVAGRAAIGGEGEGTEAWLKTAARKAFFYEKDGIPRWSHTGGIVYGADAQENKGTVRRTAPGTMLARSRSATPQGDARARSLSATPDGRGRSSSVRGDRRFEDGCSPMPFFNRKRGLRRFEGRNEISHVDHVVFQKTYSDEQGTGVGLAKSRITPGYVESHAETDGHAWAGASSWPTTGTGKKTAPLTVTAASVQMEEGYKPGRKEVPLPPHSTGVMHGSPSPIAHSSERRVDVKAGTAPRAHSEPPDMNPVWSGTRGLSSMHPRNVRGKRFISDHDLTDKIKSEAYNNEPWNPGDPEFRAGGPRGPTDRARGVRTFATSPTLASSNVERLIFGKKVDEQALKKFREMFTDCHGDKSWEFRGHMPGDAARGLRQVAGAPHSASVVDDLVFGRKLDGSAPTGCKPPPLQVLDGAAGMGSWAQREIDRHEHGQDRRHHGVRTFADLHHSTQADNGYTGEGFHGEASFKRQYAGAPVRAATIDAMAFNHSIDPNAHKDVEQLKAHPRSYHNLYEGAVPSQGTGQPRRNDLEKAAGGRTWNRPLETTAWQGKRTVPGGVCTATSCGMPLSPKLNVRSVYEQHDERVPREGIGHRIHPPGHGTDLTFSKREDFHQHFEDQYKDCAGKPNWNTGKADGDCPSNFQRHPEMPKPKPCNFRHVRPLQRSTSDNIISGGLGEMEIKPEKGLRRVPPGGSSTFVLG